MEQNIQNRDDYSKRNYLNRGMVPKTDIISFPVYDSECALRYGYIDLNYTIAPTLGPLSVKYEIDGIPINEALSGAEVRRGSYYSGYAVIKPGADLDFWEKIKGFERNVAAVR